MNHTFLRVLVFTIALYNIIPLVFISSARKIRYISTEHPTVTYYDRNLFKFMNLTSQRYGRSNPIYYVGYHVETLVYFDNNLTISFYFYEFLSNVYKRGFIEMHFGWCDLIHKDKFFWGALLRQGKFLRPCPFPPGDYHAYNMSIDDRVIPEGFPFRKGRIYCNITETATKRVVATGHINMEVKEANIKNRA